MATLRKILKIISILMIRKREKKKPQVVLLLELVNGLFGVQVCYLIPIVLLHIYPVLGCQLHSSGEKF